MRLLSLVSALALLSLGSTFSLAPSARADEKYKSRPNVQPPAERDQGGAYKRPPENRPPAERPPDREHPVKRPPDPPDPPSHDPPPPPPQGGWTPPPCPPRNCPSPDPGYGIIDDGWNPPCPIIEPPVVIAPVPMDLNSMLARRMRAMTVDGFAGTVMVGYHGGVQFESSWGASSDYDISSVTRSFTAWAVYRLVDSSKLSLATTLGELFPDAPADKRGITIEQLLAQTSGLGNTQAGEGESDRDVAVSELLAQPLAHAPGAGFTYSDDGYAMLAAAIEVASGMDYESFLVESGVIGPGMSHTSFFDDRGFGLGGGDWGMRGSRGMQSSADDLLLWTMHFLNAPEAGEITWPRTTGDDGTGIGYGWYWTNSGAGESLMRASGSVNQRDNVMVVVYPNDAVLVVTSDRSYGNLPWSERAANALEPVLRGWQPTERSPWQLSSETSDIRPH